MVCALKVGKTCNTSLLSPLDFIISRKFVRQSYFVWRGPADGAWGTWDRCCALWCCQVLQSLGRWVWDTLVLNSDYIPKCSHTARDEMTLSLSRAGSAVLPFCEADTDGLERNEVFLALCHLSHPCAHPGPGGCSPALCSGRTNPSSSECCWIPPSRPIKCSEPTALVLTLIINCLKLDIPLNFKTDFVTFVNNS